ncbi:MAG: hypothetical protein ABI658_11390 [Acidimicrobiales bacterium]
MTMVDLIEQLETVAQRGNARGATRVLSAAHGVAAQRERRRRNRRFVATGVVALGALIVAILAVRHAEDTGDVATIAGATATANAIRTEGIDAELVWGNTDRVTIGDPETGRVRVTSTADRSSWTPTAPPMAAPYAGGRYLIGSYRDAVSDLDAWTRASCADPGCALVITDRRSGVQREVPAPEGTFGFIGGGGFSPDGTKLAALAATRGSLVGGTAGGRQMQLVIIDVASTVATMIDQPRGEYGEDYGYAVWSRDGHWVFYGGLALDGTWPPKVAVHRVGTHDAVGLDLRPGYDVAAVARGVL